MVRAVCVALLLTCAPVAAGAEIATAQMTLGDLQHMCADAAAESHSACQFFILGVVDGASMANGVQTAAGPLCIAPRVPGTTLVSAVRKAIDDDLTSDPGDKTLAAAGAIVAIAMIAFPCQKSN
jgi:hypothetical protein